MTDAIKILIADDEQECIDFVRDSLADTPYDVLAAMDGEEALQVARRETPSLIILDVQMPKLGGFDVFGELRSDEKLRSVPVIMLTAITAKTGMTFDKADMGEFYGDQPEAYLDKPIEPILLRQTVKRLLKRDAAVD